MKNLVHESVDMERYKKFAIDLSSKNGDSSNIFDVRRSLQVKPKLLTKDKESDGKRTTQQDLLNSVSERMKVREIAASRRSSKASGEAKFGLSMAGKASENYGKPFSYIKGCLPATRKLDSNRSAGS